MSDRRLVRNIVVKREKGMSKEKEEKKDKRFKVSKTGYKFDKFIFRVGFVVLLFYYLAIFLWGLKYGTIYIECPESELMCYNYFYHNCYVEETWRYG